MEYMNDELEHYINLAYKKLKSNVYFDKTQLPLLNKIVKFEAENLEKSLKELREKLLSKEEWEKYEEDILNNIKALIFPKKISDANIAQQDKDDKEIPIIFNEKDGLIKLKRAQYFIDLPVIGHIIGVLWVLTIGLTLDNRNDPNNTNMYEHSYGNRLSKTIVNKETGKLTCSPHLFEPYFSQYESWRDRALEHAKKRLDEKQDAIILTLDFSNFYYSVDIDKEAYGKLFQEFEELNETQKWHNRVHEFVYKVLCEYTKCLSKINVDEELKIEKEAAILPIGFLPSNILSNWTLNQFDEAIIKRWNPVYYGRYVDDIIIVDKVEKNSLLHKWASGEDEQLTPRKIIDYYFRLCSSDRKKPPNCANEHGVSEQELFMEIPDGGKMMYNINPKILNGEKNDIRIQNDKVKLFYFREGATKALLDVFRTKIAKNTSEFRYLPELDKVIGYQDFSEIFTLNSSDTINKLRGITSITLDKFALSKFLGKYRKISGMIRDNKEISLENELLIILDKRALLENYTLWECLLEIMIINGRLDNYKKLVKKIIEAITQFVIPDDLVKGSLPKEALWQTLEGAIYRTAALAWGREVSELGQKLLQDIKKECITIDFRNFDKHREDYCSARMVNKYVMPIPIDFLNIAKLSSATSNIYLSRLEDMFAYMSDEWEKIDYAYYPYMVTPHELSFALACRNIVKGEKLSDPKQQYKKIEKMYQNWNYFGLEHDNKRACNFILDKIKVEQLAENTEGFVTSVDTGECSKKLKVAIGNARLNPKDFENVLMERPNRSYKRYQQLSKLLYDAVKERVEILVLPENYLPLDWVPDIVRLCANNQIGLITGIEHIVSPSKNGDLQRNVYNLTAIILPYQQENYKYAYVTYHQKVHPSPEEKRQITGYGFDFKKGDRYHLFQWRDVWFSVYCCFELASIQERALFKTFADIIVAVEWNKDVLYFGNIIESLCRDLHCFCIQANSSDYGDSRVISPSKSEKMNLIKTKGGTNSAILVDEIDIAALREFQRKSYELQRDDKTFKPTPPNFDTNIAMHKQKGTLWDVLKLL